MVSFGIGIASLRVTRFRYNGVAIVCFCVGHRAALLTGSYEVELH